jgi:hypothetical protein
VLAFNNLPLLLPLLPTARAAAPVAVATVTLLYLSLQVCLMLRLSCMSA